MALLLRRRQSRNRHRTVERVEKRRRRRTPGRASSARERSRTVAGTASAMGAAPNGHRIWRAKLSRRVHAGSRTDTVSERSDGGVLVGGGQPGPARAA
ncbi:MAG TPA: hypothetical protein VF875_13785, partial [Anaeromyxobacter sp.]